MLNLPSCPYVAVLTLGCKVNQYESEAIGEALEAAGIAVADVSCRCDGYIINTCTVTAESDRKARQMIRRLIAKDSSAYIVVTGCSAQADAARIAAFRGWTPSSATETNCRW